MLNVNYYNIIIVIISYHCCVFPWWYISLGHLELWQHRGEDTVEQTRGANAYYMLMIKTLLLLIITLLLYHIIVVSFHGDISPRHLELRQHRGEDTVEQTRGANAYYMLMIKTLLLLIITLLLDHIIVVFFQRWYINPRHLELGQHRGEDAVEPTRGANAHINYYYNYYWYYISYHCVSSPRAPAAPRWGRR